jgi:hypothetical protein
MKLYKLSQEALKMTLGLTAGLLYFIVVHVALLCWRARIFETVVNLHNLVAFAVFGRDSWFYK